MQARTFISLSAILIATYTTGCNDSNGSTQRTSDVDTAIAPVETKKANSNYKPAFKGQTRIAGVKTTTAYKADKIAEKIGRPWAVIPFADGRLLVTDKTGFMQIFDANGTLIKKITGFP